jgi:hypothetical protein
MNSPRIRRTVIETQMVTQERLSPQPPKDRRPSAEVSVSTASIDAETFLPHPPATGTTFSQGRLYTFPGSPVPRSTALND